MAKKFTSDEDELKFWDMNYKNIYRLIALSAFITGCIINRDRIFHLLESIVDCFK